MSSQSEIIFQSRDIDLKNLPKTDCHLHTSWTDGAATVEEVYRTAVETGLKAILYSEHSRKTSTDWFGKFADEVRNLSQFPCKAYVGTEVKVESRDGDIDTNAEISGRCDFVMASVHRFINENGKTMQFSETDPELSVELEYSLSWAVLQNPQVDILGHMFGMSYKRFGQKPSETKIKELIARAAKFEVAIEINSNYHPSALNMLRWCQEYDAKICFGSNAHLLNEVGAIMRQIEEEVLEVQT
jgi:histidinol phosphatase-like PHP family hydrolase